MLHLVLKTQIRKNLFHLLRKVITTFLFFDKYASFTLKTHYTFCNKTNNTKRLVIKLDNISINGERLAIILII